jgi:1,4-alpha-glucan branching enzyme
MTNSRDIVIYEAHVGTFMGPSGTFSSFTNKLDYLRDLGVSAIELMPVNEFPSATSWGYNPAYPFSIETSYGAPDALRQLVLRSHQSGIAMLLDVVHNHWDGGSSLWQFDGWSPDGVHGGQYFYNTEPYANTPWGPRPDYSTSQVCATINDTFRMWLDEYRFDGFRWDAPSHILFTTNGIFIPEGLDMITNALAVMAAEHPGTLNIAEDIKELSGFNSYWDLTFVWEIRSVLTQGDDSNRDMPTVARNVAGTFQRVIYTDSHDTAGDLNGGTRLPTAIYGAQAEGYYARKRSTLGAALIMTSPGTPMILQGQEMLETNQFSDTRGVDWARTNTFAGITRLYRDLIRLRRNLDGVSEGLLGDGCSTYQVDNVNKLVAYSRWSSDTPDRCTVVVANFANMTRWGYPVNFPAAGTWYVHFNSDSTNYAADYGNEGSIEVAAAGSPPYGTINVGPYSVLILSQTPRTGMLIRETASADQPAGNGDGVLDPGETIREQIVLWNKSQLSATNVSAVLSSATPGVTIVQGSSPYAAMAPDGSSTNSAMFEYSLAPTVTCGSVISFELAAAFNGQVLTNIFDHVVGQFVNQPSITNLFSVDVPTPIPDFSTAYSSLPINEADDPVIEDINVQLRINHTYDEDLVLALQHPDGSEVLLVNKRGRSKDNFGTGTCGSATYTVLDQSAAIAISSGTAPFAGTYRPESTLDTFNGKPLNGTWRLRMRDVYLTDAGTNLCWSIRAIYEQRSCDCSPFSNRAPVATATQIVLVGYVPTNIALNGTDADSQVLTFHVTNAPSHGLLSAVNTSTWQTLYTPIHGYIGTDTFDFVAADGLTNSLPATIHVAVQAPPDSDGDGMPDAWEQACFTNPTATLPDGDNDHDGIMNLDEYRANTNPNDSNSVLRLTGLTATAGGYTVQWNSIGGTRYGLEFSPGVTDTFTRIVRPLLSEMDCSPKGTPTNMTFTDDFTLTPPPDQPGLRLYRLRVVDE